MTGPSPDITIGSCVPVPGNLLQGTACFGSGPRWSRNHWRASSTTASSAPGSCQAAMSAAAAPVLVPNSRAEGRASAGIRRPRRWRLRDALRAARCRRRGHGLPPRPRSADRIAASRAGRCPGPRRRARCGGSAGCCRCRARHTGPSGSCSGSRNRPSPRWGANSAATVRDCAIVPFPSNGGPVRSAYGSAPPAPIGRLGPAGILLMTEPAGADGSCLADRRLPSRQCGRRPGLGRVFCAVSRTGLGNCAGRVDVPSAFLCRRRPVVNTRLSARFGAAVLALSFGVISPVLAQAIPKGDTGTGKPNESEQTVRSKTERGGPGQSSSASAEQQPTTAQTGVGPRGTQVGPSTSPGESGVRTR